MSRTAHKLMSASGSKGYEIDQSLLCSEGDGSKLRRTPSSAGNRKTFTFSTWCKRSNFGLGGSGGAVYDALFGAYNAGSSDDSEYFFFGFNNNDFLTIGGWTVNWKRTNRKFRDPAAWHHIVLQVDTTQATADNRFKMYVDGVQETSFETSTNPSQNLDTAVNATYPQAISDVAYDAGTGPYHFDGYMAETHLFDGAVVAPSEFGETDSDTGEWIPKKYTGTASYGTNGYYMKYVSGAIGTDSSGQSNNYTTTNLANSDVMLDTPTNNFNTLNPLNNGSYTTLSQGNLACQGNTDADAGWAHSTIPMTSGKWYAESIIGTVSNWAPTAISISDIGTNGGSEVNNLTSSYYSNYASGARQAGASEEYGSTFTEQSGMDTGTALSAGAIISCAVDVDNKKLFFAINGTYLGSGNPATGANPTFTWTIDTHLVFSTQQAFASPSASTYNFGQNGTFTGATTAGGNSDGNGYGNFKYAVPSGFKALCTQNLATPTIKKSSEHFNTVLYTGSDNDAVSQNVTGAGHQPDLVWIKRRNLETHHVLTDAVRGATKVLNSNQTVAEVDDTYGVTAFGSDGFTVREQDVAGGQTNTGTLVSWNWKAGGSTSANTAGDINSTVSVNSTAGFSIVTYTGNRTGAGVSTVGHGLSVAPKVVITKSISNATSWWIQHSGTSTASKLLRFDTTAETDKSGNGTLSRPTSTVFGTNWTDGIGTNGHTMVAYCFAEVDGFSKFGRHTGNGESENGPFIYTGFKPRLVIIKKSSVANFSWFMWDSLRHPENVIDLAVWADANNGDTSHAEYEIDFLSNGFKLRGNNAGSNASGATHFYMAFAEAPFKYATAR